MALNVTNTRELMAQAFAGLGSWLSLHTSDPGTTGANEATGGSPAYARKQTTWSNGSVDGTVTGSQVTFDVQAGTYTHVGLWTDDEDGEFISSIAVGPATRAAQGTIPVTPTYTQS